MSGQRDFHAGRGRHRCAVPFSLALSLLAGCNSILGLEASTLEEGSTTGATSGTTATGGATASSTSTTGSTATTSGSGGDGGESASTTGTGGGGGDVGGAGGGGSDPCGAGTWGMLENGGFECGLRPWTSSDGAAQLEITSPGFGDRGSAGRFHRASTTNAVYQPLGEVEVDATMCFVASFAARSSDGSGQISAALVFIDPPGHLLEASFRNLGPTFAQYPPLSCRVPASVAGTWTARFYVDVHSLTDDVTTVSVDVVEADLVPCSGGEPDCDLPSG